MDPFSQAALGAVVGQASGHRRLGYGAVALGALAGALPDIDVLFSIGGDDFDQFVLHRGITHSLFFAPVAGPLLGAVAWALADRRRREPLERGRLGAWILVATLALWSHPLLDVLTSYGTQLLLPFSDRRFAINAMPIIDPVYTAILAVGLLAALRPWSRHARRGALVTLALSCAYLGYGWSLNAVAEAEARRQLAAAGVQTYAVAAFPTILQVHYRRVVARTDDQDRVGFLSTWRPCPITWVSAPRAEADTTAIEAFLATREGRIFDWFTMGWARYRIDEESAPDMLRATDLRYGFTADPNSSIFTARAPVAPDGTLVGPVVAGRDGTDTPGERLAELVQETYAAECRLGSP